MYTSLELCWVCCLDASRLRILPVGLIGCLVYGLMWHHGLGSSCELWVGSFNGFVFELMLFDSLLWRLAVWRIGWLVYVGLCRLVVYCFGFGLLDFANLSDLCCVACAVGLMYLWFATYRWLVSWYVVCSVICGCLLWLGLFAVYGFGICCLVFGIVVVAVIWLQSRVWVGAVAY